MVTQQQKFGDYQQSLGPFSQKAMSLGHNRFECGRCLRYVAGLLLLFFDPATCFKALA